MCSLGGQAGLEEVGDPGCLQSSRYLFADILPWNISHFPVPCSFSDYQPSLQFLRSTDNEYWWRLEKVYPVSVQGGRAVACYLWFSTPWPESRRVTIMWLYQRNCKGVLNICGLDMMFVPNTCQIKTLFFLFIKEPKTRGTNDPECCSSSSSM